MLPFMTTQTITTSYIKPINKKRRGSSWLVGKSCVFGVFLHFKEALT